MTAYEFIINLRNQASSELQRVARDVAGVDRSANQFNNSLRRTEVTTRSLGSTLGGLKGKLLGLFAGASLFAFTNQIVDARAEYEKFDAVLTNTFQSKEIGQGALAMLTDFAAKTPYQLNELTGSFIKLANRGIAPSYLEMTKLGDLASSQGKSFDQLTEAIMDAQTGEFERMKEFGIRASKSGDKVALTFKGITKEVAMNDTAIKDAILTYGDMAGVAGSMDVISKTLGGRIANLADQWWGFLVAVGGYGGGIMGDFLDFAGQGLAFIQAHLPQIAHWFNLLWQYLSPLVVTIKEFLKAAFGFNDASSALEIFGNVMTGVLLIINWLSTGISTLLNWLQPLAPYLLDGAIAWGIFSLAMAMTPIGWIVLGIMALITIIGLLMKYTDGWGKSFTALGNLIKLWWIQVKADFAFGVDTAIYHFKRLHLKAFEIFDKIGQKIANVSKSIKQALDFDFSGAYDTLNKNITSNATKEIERLDKEQNDRNQKYIKGSVDRIKQAKKEIGDIGVTADFSKIGKDAKNVKNLIANATGEKSGNIADYSNYLDKNKSPLAPGMKSGKDKDKTNKAGKDGIVSGGSKQTHITITIGKLQDQTVIHVNNKEKGLQEAGDKLQEILLRAVNSVNQMQT